MPKRGNSDQSSNASSDQNDSESEQEIIKHSSKKKKSKIVSDSESDNRSDQSNDSSDDEKEIVEKSKKKKVIDSGDDKSDSDSDSDKSNKSNASNKSNKSNRSNKSNGSNKSNKQKSDDDKPNKSDSEKSDDDEIFSTKKRTKQIMDSDSDSDSDHRSEASEKRIKNERNENMDDIFGEMSDEDEENEKKAKTENGVQDDDENDEERENEERENEENNEENRDIFQEFEEEDQVPETETRIDVTIPKIVADLGREHHFVKLPNFLSVDTHPYDPSWYEDEIDEDEILDDEGRGRMKLKVENTIRWRNVVDKDGNMSKESNARIIKWSDGSMSLHLGSEIFDIHKQQILGVDNHLYIRQGTGLQGQSVFRTKLTFRPHSTDSFTHKKMTLSLADRSQKTQKIRVLPVVGLDPEQNRTDLIKKEEDKLRASLRRENKARRVRERVNQRGPTASYLEPDMDDDENAISLSAIKNKYKQRGQSYADVYSDSDSGASSNESIFNKKKASAVKKAAKIEESDED